MIKSFLGKLIEYISTFRKVFQLIWKCSNKYTLLFILINIALGCYSPILLIIWKYFIDAISEVISIGITEIYLPMVFLLLHCVIAILIDLTNQLSNYVEETLLDHLNKYIIEITMEKISCFELYHFDDAELYNKIEKVNNESTQRTVSLLTLTVNLIRSVTILAGTAVILSQLNIILVFICFLACIPMFIVNTKVFLKRYSLFNERVEKLRLVHTLSYMFSKYENIKEIKIFRLGQYLKQLTSDVYKKHISEDTTIRKSFMVKKSSSGIFQNIISYGFKIYILCLVILKKVYTIGDLTMFVSAIDSFQSSTAFLLSTISNLYVDSLYLQNLFSLMNTKIEAKGGLNFPSEFKVIEFQDVWFKYPKSDKYILKNFSCRLEADKSYSIVGLNGSGKTTFVKLLTKLYAPTKGKILIDGINLQEIDSLSYYKNIGVIFQDFIKYPFNVSDNIGVGKIEDIGVQDLIHKAAIKAEADSFIKKLPKGYQSLLQKEWSDGIELSLGQWQKIAISRAYMSESPIIVLDEPTASLDAEAEYGIYQHFKKLMSGRMCILISHRLSADKLVDHIYYLKDGMITEKGSHDELMSQKGEYYTLYSMQADAYIA